MKRIILRIILAVLVIIVVLVAYLVDLDHSFSQISEGEKIPEYETDKAALLVIDIQEATTGTAALNDTYTKLSNGFINSVNRLIDSAQNHNIPVIYIYSETTNWLVNLLDNSMEKGTVGTKPDKRLHIASNFAFSKGKLDAFSNSSLDSLLLSQHINKLYISGLDPAYCINNTIQAALNRGYDVTVINEAIVSESDSLKLQKINDFEKLNVKTIGLNDFPL